MDQVHYMMIEKLLVIQGRSQNAVETLVRQDATLPAFEHRLGFEAASTVLSDIKGMEFKSMPTDLQDCLEGLIEHRRH